MGELEKKRGEITWRREISRVLSSLSPSISILVAIWDFRVVREKQVRSRLDSEERSFFLSRSEKLENEFFFY